ncbi:hypothetical protein D8674_000823 [Pyrus ussuriensis x Pyrus communis]|uniref:Uncharacterized protein n=1 Tax=Pyrus ussuriensis x Pyrus communis TaxID=2448454 RepID=A0A5N5F565_9ROSA|nr:hypothetical protein D8674_000823 [Pyrus ussuriensis x Pyrus communis]
MQLVATQSESTNINAIPFGFWLSDSNFKVWSKMMEIHASGLGKQGYLMGKISADDEDDPGYVKLVLGEKEGIKGKGNKRTGQARVAVTRPGEAPGVRGLATIAASQPWFTSSNTIAAAQAARTTSEATSTGDDTSPLLSLINQISMSDNWEDPGKNGTVLITSTKRDTGWIIDSGASDHMTYDASLFYYMTSPSKEEVITANGDVAPVTRAGSISLTPSLSIHNALLVPSLFNHLLSVGQVTEQLDCVVLMFPTFCLLQDIQTRAIIGRGIKRRGLYYVDDVSASRCSACIRAKVFADHVTLPSSLWLCSLCMNTEDYSWIDLPTDYGCEICSGGICQPLVISQDPTMGLSDCCEQPSSIGEPNLGSLSSKYKAGGLEGLKAEGFSEPSMQYEASASNGPCCNEPHSSTQNLDRSSTSNNLSPVVPVHVPKDIRELSPKYQAFVNTMDGINIPTKVEEALRDPRWTEAMKIEMKALQKNRTCSMQTLPQGKKPVGCKWVFTIKHKTDRTINIYKARLVAKGYAQTFGVDYQETFASVAKMNTIRVLLSLAINFDWPLKQFDIKNARLFMGMLACKPAKTPIVQNHQLAIYPDQVPANRERYQRRSISGYFTFVGGNLVTWKSKKQNVVARSTAEAEYCANNPIQHDRTKHVEVDRHFIKEKLVDKLVEIPYVRSEDQLADVLTHAVSARVFQDPLDNLKNRSRMGNWIGRGNGLHSAEDQGLTSHRTSSNCLRVRVRMTNRQLKELMVKVGMNNNGRNFEGLGLVILQECLEGRLVAAVDINHDDDEVLKYGRVELLTGSCYHSNVASLEVMSG